MSEVSEQKDKVLEKLGVRWLTPDTTQVFEGTYSLMHCTVKNDDTYRGVFVALMFPISHPDKYVSLRYTDSDDKIKEIGIVRELSAFDPETQRLIRQSLNKNYYEQIIIRVHDVKFELGLLFFDVETQRGREEFMMYWSYDKAQEFSTNGKLLLDIYENRYIIQDMSELPARDQDKLTRFIYW